MNRCHVLALGALLLSGCTSSTHAPEPGSSPLPSVGVVAVHYGSLETGLDVTGVLVAPRDAQAVISPTLTGRVQRLPVRIGQFVHQGDVVAELNVQAVEGQIHQAEATVAQNRVQVHQAQANAIQQQAQTDSAILQARAAVATAQAALTGAQATLHANEAALGLSQRNYNRLHRLEKDGLVAQKDVDAAEGAVEQAKAQVESQVGTVAAARRTVESQQESLRAAEAQRLTVEVKREDIVVAQQQVQNAEGALETAVGQRDLYILRAPMDGTVTAVGTSVGETADTTVHLVSLADLRRLEMQLAVPSQSIRDVHVGQAIRAQVDGTPTALASRVEQVGSGVDTSSDSVTVRARIDNAQRRIPNGAYVRARITTRTLEHVLLVPAAAVLRATDGKTAVLVLDDKQVVHRTAVVVAFKSETQAAIESGLHDGDKVVDDGAYGLPDGALVEVRH